MAKNDITKIEKGRPEPLDLSGMKDNERASRAGKISAERMVAGDEDGVDETRQVGNKKIERLLSEFTEAYRSATVGGDNSRAEELRKLERRIRKSGAGEEISRIVGMVDRERIPPLPPVEKDEPRNEGNEEAVIPPAPVILENKEVLHPVIAAKEKSSKEEAVESTLSPAQKFEEELFHAYLRYLPEIKKGGKGLPQKVAERIDDLKRELKKFINKGGNPERLKSPEELRSIAEEIYSAPREGVSEEEVKFAKQELFAAEKKRFEEFKRQGSNSSGFLNEFGKAREKLFTILRKTKWATVPDWMIDQEIERELGVFDEKIRKENLLRGIAAGDEVFFGPARDSKKNITKKDSKKSKLDTDTVNSEGEDYLRKHPKEPPVKKRGKKNKNGIGAEPPANLPVVDKITEPVLDSEVQEQINGLWEDYGSEEQRKEIERLWNLYLEQEAADRAEFTDLPEQSMTVLGRGSKNRFESKHPKPPIKEKISELEFDKARAEYLKIYGEHNKKNTQRVSFLRAKIFGWKTKSDDVPEDLREAELAYKTARKEYAKILYDKEKEDLQEEIRPREFNGTKEEYIDSELVKYRSKLFKKFFLEENIKLKEAKADSYPPREKNIILRAWGKWAGIDKYKRLAITSTLIGGAAAITASGLAPAAILFGIGARAYRGAKGLAGAGGGGILAQKGMELYYGNKLEDWKKETEEKLAREFDSENPHLAQEKYEIFLKEYQKRKNIETAVQVAAAFAGGYFGTTGVDLIEKNWFSGSGLAAREVINQTGKANLRLPDSSSSEMAVRVTGFVDSAPKGAGQGAAEAIPESPKTAIPEAVAEPESIEVKKGQGAWNPVHELLKNQLEKDPEAFLKKINLKINPEELKTPGAAEKILNRETLRLLNEQGYMEGGETLKGISKAGVRVSLDADNKIIMTGKGKTTYDFPKSEAVGAVEPEVDGLKPFHGHESVPDGQESATASVIEESRIGREPDIYPDAPVEGAEVPTPALEIPESQVIVAPELPNFPSISQKETYLNKIFGANDGFFKDEKIPELAKVIKSERLTVGDIDKYVSAKGATPLPERALHNLKEYFKVVADDDFPLQEKLQAMRGIRGSFQIMRMQMGFARAGF
ncbi:MAG: hypothetical protein NTW60_04300 [Candidatus Wolfebacteria bacterium]|nr:hypothetical protein [Candidatus Wolfebacteria bacterium]